MNSLESLQSGLFGLKLSQLQLRLRFLTFCPYFARLSTNSLSYLGSNYPSETSRSTKFLLYLIVSHMFSTSLSCLKLIFDSFNFISFCTLIAKVRISSSNTLELPIILQHDTPPTRLMLLKASSNKCGSRILIFFRLLIPN